MTQRKYGQGWFNESRRHGLARMGVKTGRKLHGEIYHKPITKVNYSLQNNKYISEHNWSFEIVGKDKLKVTLGNLTDAGWFWNGNEDDLILFLDRINRSRVTQRFLSSMKKNRIAFNDLKPLLIKSVDTGSGLYSITGDNVRWKFGEGDDYHFEDAFDYQVEQGNVKESEKEKLKDEFWAEYSGVDYDEFIKENGDELKSLIKESVKDNNSYDGFFRDMDNVRERAEELYIDSLSNKIDGTMNKSIKNIKR